MAAYEHTQRGKLHWILWLATLACLAGGLASWNEVRWAAWVCLGAAGLTFWLSFCFLTLTVRDQGAALAVRFGPLTVFEKLIPYTAIRDARPARSTLLDGWGIHWVPGRGWTWNLWTFDCVEMQVDGKPFRIGSDDKEALAAFLQSRTATGDLDAPR